MIIKKSDLKLVKTIITPEQFDFNGEIDAEMFGNILIDKMLELGGIGLSANQVGVNTSIFVMGNKNVQTVVINPQIVSYSAATTSLDEGCLTYPGVYMKVSRPVSVHVKFQNVKGEWVEEMFYGLTARIFQHEFDHMQGETFKDRVSKMKWDLAYNRMIKRTKKIVKQNVQKQLLKIKKQLEAPDDSNT